MIVVALDMRNRFAKLLQNGGLHWNCHVVWHLLAIIRKWLAVLRFRSLGCIYSLIHSLIHSIIDKETHMTNSGSPGPLSRSCSMGQIRRDNCDIQMRTVDGDICASRPPEQVAISEVVVMSTFAIGSAVDRGEVAREGLEISVSDLEVPVSFAANELVEPGSMQMPKPPCHACLVDSLAPMNIHPMSTEYARYIRYETGPQM
jgi:hypothetical protein